MSLKPFCQITAEVSLQFYITLQRQRKERNEATKFRSMRVKRKVKLNFTMTL